MGRSYRNVKESENHGIDRPIQTMLATVSCEKMCFWGLSDSSQKQVVCIPLSTRVKVSESALTRTVRLSSH